uniref:Uncharacterized protein n=1 Tax=Parascaris univalens TaxID=6257 RepID=A0A914ZP61_PARUN
MRTSNEWTIDRRARKDAIDAIMTIVDMTKLRSGVVNFDSPCIPPEKLERRIEEAMKCDNGIIRKKLSNRNEMLILYDKFS